MADPGDPNPGDTFLGHGAVRRASTTSRDAERAAKREEKNREEDSYREIQDEMLQDPLHLFKKLSQRFETSVMAKIDIANIGWFVKCSSSCSAMMLVSCEVKACPRSPTPGRGNSLHPPSHNAMCFSDHSTRLRYTSLLSTLLKTSVRTEHICLRNAYPYRIKSNDIRLH